MLHLQFGLFIRFLLIQAKLHPPAWSKCYIESLSQYGPTRVQFRIDFKKKDSQKIKLSGRDVWSEQFSGLYFEVTENKIIQLGNDTELPNNQKDIQLVEDGIVVSYLGKKVFDVSKSKPYTITVTNVDDKPAHFKAYVVNR